MIQPNFTIDSINKALEKRVELIRKEIIDSLEFLGNKCIIEAKTNRGYGIISGNLTSSVGYVIVDHGTIIKVAGFEKPITASSDRNGKNEDGAKEGKSLADSLAKKASSKGYALIVVAGMHYASHIEAMGLNVIGSAELLAERQLPAMLKDLKVDISKMK